MEENAVYNAQKAKIHSYESLFKIWETNNDDVSLN